MDRGDDFSFYQTKEALAAATMLTYPHSQAPIALTSDASATAVGAVLEQLVDGIWRHMAFF